MRNTLSLTAVGHATSAFFAITFALCVASCLVFPAPGFVQLLQEALPGFQWLTWRSFFLGLVETYGYGWYVALIWVPIYNVLARREKQQAV